MSLVRNIPGAAPGKRQYQRAEGSVVRALTSGFNVVALNLSVVVVTLGVVTAPLAVVAAQRAIYCWRTSGDDRVVSKFWAALRLRPLRAWVAVGLPMAVSSVGVAEVRHFSSSVTPEGAVCLALGVLTAALGAAAAAYVSLFLAGVRDAPDTGPVGRGRHRRGPRAVGHVRSCR